jgi:hypothetical protein
MSEKWQANSLLLSQEVIASKAKQSPPRVSGIASSLTLLAMTRPDEFSDTLLERKSYLGV